MQTSPHSFTYDNHILLELVNSTVEDVSLKEGLSYESMAGALERRIEGSVDWSGIAETEILGLDEIALKKGHRSCKAGAVSDQFRCSSEGHRRSGTRSG